MQLPEYILPVVEILRRDVPKPDKDSLKPTYDQIYCVLSGDNCPMGLHPCAWKECPDSSWSFCGVHDAGLDDAVCKFYKWWDKLTLPEAREAVDLIWPP